ncbi:MAG: TolC family outer membrane protein [Parvularculaceae bacterium]
MAAVAAEPSVAQSLAEALRRTYDTNPTIAAERARFRAAGEAKAQAWSAVLPQIVAGGSVERVDNDTDVVAAPGGIDPTLFGATDASTRLDTIVGEVSGELEVFNGLRNVNAIRQARARIEAGGASLAAVEQDVLTRAAAAYFDVLRDLSVFTANAKNVEVLAARRREAEVRFEVGDVTRTDVAQAEARLAGARADLAGAQAGLALSRASFAEIVGDPPADLDPEPGLPAAPETLDAAIELARGYAPNALAARAAADASRRGVAIARSAFAPSVSLTTRYRYAEDPNFFVETDEQFAYGVRASVPLFTGGLNLSRVREAKALAEADRRNVDAAERRAEAETIAAWERRAAALAGVRSAEAGVAANELALKGVRLEADVGARTTLDVLDAEQELLTARVALANARRDARVARFEILRSVGLLTIDAVEAAAGDADMPSAR